MDGVEVSVVNVDAEQRAFEVLRCERKPGQKTRIAFEYEGSWRYMLWIEIRPDGTICLAPRYKNPGRVRTVGPIVGRGGSVDIPLDGGQDVLDPERLSGAKASFHASGIVTFVGDRSRQDHAIRDLRGTHLLATVASSTQAASTSLHSEQQTFGSPPLDETRPLVAYLYASPAGREKNVIQTNAVFQKNVLITCVLDAKEVPDLAAQLVFAHRAEASWPQSSAMLWSQEISEGNGRS